MNECALDTNVLLRLARSSDPEYEECRRATRALVLRHVNIFILPQNLVELWAVATRPVEARGFGYTPEQTNLIISDLLNSYALLPETEEVFAAWRELVASHRVTRKRAHDAKIAALLKVSEIKYLVTYNLSDFKSFTHLEPLTPAHVLERLA